MPAYCKTYPSIDHYLIFFSKAGEERKHFTYPIKIEGVFGNKKGLKPLFIKYHVRITSQHSVHWDKIFLHVYNKFKWMYLRADNWKIGFFTPCHLGVSKNWQLNPNASIISQSYQINLRVFLANLKNLHLLVWIMYTYTNWNGNGIFGFVIDWMCTALQKIRPL